MARKRDTGAAGSIAGGAGRIPGGAGRFAYDGLDRLLHEKARLGILTSLLTHGDGLRFGELKELCALTDGNLSRHLQLLHESGLVEIWKGVEGRRPQTLCRLSESGRRRFLEYLQALEQVLQDAEALGARATGTAATPRGWAPA